MPFQHSCIVFLTLVPLLQLLFHLMASIGSLVSFYWSFFLGHTFCCSFRSKSFSSSKITLLLFGGYFSTAWCVCPYVLCLCLLSILSFKFSNVMCTFSLISVIATSNVALTVPKLVYTFPSCSVFWWPMCSMNGTCFFFIVILFFFTSSISLYTVLLEASASVRSNVSRHHRVLIVTIPFL